MSKVFNSIKTNLFKSSKSASSTIPGKTISPASSTTSTTTPAVPQQTAALSTTTAPKMASKVPTDTFIEAMKFRRTVYGINDKPPIANPEERIEKLVNEVMLTLPSSFNSQSARMVVVLGEQHKRFWDVIIAAAKPVILQFKSEEDWERNEKRFQTFRAGYGTIAFFEDNVDIKAMQEKFPDFADAFGQFSEHSSAMHQIALWTAVELEGFGANLQHSNHIPGVEDGLRKEFDLPATWSCKAQLVFGGMTQDMPERPEKKPLSDTIKFFK